MIRSRICLLGSLKIVADEEGELTFRTRKTTGLFAYLALRAGQRHSRDFLCELFWPDADAGASRLSLRVALSSLRKSLGDVPGAANLLRVEGDTVWIDDDCDVDACQFELLYQQAASVEDPEERLAAIGRALDSYAGELVPNCEESLLESERSRLAEMSARLLRRRGQTLYRLRRFDEALAAALESLKQDSTSEAAYRIAIRCDMASGRHEAAVSRYRELDRLMAAEGRPPEPKTVRLGEDLIAGRISTIPDGPPAQLRTHSDVPQPLTPYFGRSGETERLAGLLVDPTAPVRHITLLGLGGSGKTRLAIEVARQIEAFGTARLAWLALAGRQSVAEVRTAIAAAFDVESGSLQLGVEVVRRIGEEPTIIVLDNLEHLLAREPESMRELVVELLEASQLLRVLGASRVPLEVSGEMRYVVPMLEMPEPNSTAMDAKSVPAVQLFVDRARRRRADFELDETNVADISEIVRRLDGMPLALELAAIWVTALSPATLVQRLTDRFELLSTDEADVDARHKRLESVIEASVAQLPAECLSLYLNLCALPDAAPLEVVQAVGGLKSPLQTAALLSVLVERALARRERRTKFDGELFIVPECLREFGAVQLGRKEHSAAMGRVASFISLTLENSTELGRTDVLRASRELRPLMPTIEGVIAWCESERDAKLGLQIATACPPLWSLTSRQLVGRQFLARLLPVPGIPDELRIEASLLAANLSVEAGEILSAEQFVRGIVQDAKNLSFLARVRAVALASQISNFQLDLDEVAKRRDELLALLEQDPAPGAEADILSALSSVHNDLGDHLAASERDEEAILLIRQTSDRYKLGGSLAGLAFNLNCIGSVNRAEAAILESIDIARESNHLAGIAHRLWIYGCIVVGRDRVRARELWLESLKFHRELNNRQELVWTLGNLAMADLEDQQFERADAYLRERLRHARAVDDRGAIVQTYNLMLRAEILQRDWPKARELAVERHRLGVQPWVEAIELGWLAEQSGNRTEAVRRFTEAREAAGEDDDLALFARMCLREPLDDDARMHKTLALLDSSPSSVFGRMGSEIVSQAIRSVRLRHALTPP